MKFLFIILLIVTPFKKIKLEDEEKHEYALDKIKLTFINAGECGCEESCSFHKESDDSYSFSISTNFNSENKLIVETDFAYDSLFIYQREIYKYALVISETEGVFFYDFDLIKKKQSNYKYGAWRFLPLNAKNQFSIYDRFESRSFNEMLPNIDTNRAKEHLVKLILNNEGEEQDSEKIKEYIKEKTFGVFVYEVQLRLKYYINGKIVRKTLSFMYRHGEC